MARCKPVVYRSIVRETGPEQRVLCVFECAGDRRKVRAAARRYVRDSRPPATWTLEAIGSSRTRTEDSRGRILDAVATAGAR